MTIAWQAEIGADPELVKQWMGPDGTDLNIEEWDFTTNGHWSHWGESEGVKYTFRGVFHTVRENEFAIQTFEFEPVPDTASIESLRFEDLGDGRITQLTRDGSPTIASIHSRRNLSP